MIGNEIMKLLLGTIFDTSVLIFILICILVLHHVSNYLKTKKLYEFSKQFPGPPLVPYFGNSLDFMKGADATIMNIIDYTKEYGCSPYRLWLGSEPYIVISDPQHLEQAFSGSSILDKPVAFQNAFADIYGNSIFTMTGAELKMRRKKVMHIFRTNNLLKFIPTMHKEIFKLISKINKHVETDQSFDLYSYVPVCNFDVVTKTMMNLSVDPIHSNTVCFHDLNLRSVRLSYLRLFAPWGKNTILESILYNTSPKKMKSSLRNCIKNITAQQINSIKKYESKNKDFCKENLRNLYLKEMYKISVDEQNENILYDEMLTIIGADKLYDEIFEVFRGSNRRATSEDIKKLPYLDQVIKEVLRITINPYLYRRCTEEIQIGDYKYPAGTNIIISVIGAHFNPQSYSNPWNFNPENFSPELTKSRSKFSYIPFGVGSRNCIGQKYAILELKLSIIELLRKFRFHTDLKIENLKMVYMHMTNSSNQYPVQVTTRKDDNYFSKISKQHPVPVIRRFSFEFYKNYNSDSKRRLRAIIRRHNSLV